MLAIDSWRSSTPATITDADARRAGTSRDDVLAMLAAKRRRRLPVTFHVAGEDPRIALREQDDLSADDVAVLRRAAWAASTPGRPGRGPSACCA